MDVYLVLQITYDCFLLGVYGYALRGGGRDERLAAALLLSCSAATAIVTAVPGYTWARDHWQVTAIDVSLLIGLGWLGSVSKRFWPLWATAFQLIDLTVHFLASLSAGRILQAYVMLQGFWAYPILICVAIGTRQYLHRSRVTKRPLRGP